MSCLDAAAGFVASRPMKRSLSHLAGDTTSTMMYASKTVNKNRSDTIAVFSSAFLLPAATCLIPASPKNKHPAIAEGMTQVLLKMLTTPMAPIEMFANPNSCTTCRGSSPFIPRMLSAVNRG